MTKNKIIGVDGEKISSIDLDEFIFTGFSRPCLIHDSLRKKQSEPELKVHDNIDILKDIDFILCAYPITKDDTWAKRQKYIVFIRPDDAPLQKGTKILNKLPANHFIELDIANSKVRVIGAFVNKDGVGGWSDY